VNGWNQVALKVIIKYLPNSFDHPDDDVPDNYEKAEGFIFLGNGNLKGFNMLSEITPKDLEYFIKTNIPNYTP
jgi:hypothetical protein